MAEDCAVCRLVRTYVLFAVPLLAMIGAFALGDSSGEQLWFADTRLIDVLSWGSLAALVGIVTYKAYKSMLFPRDGCVGWRRCRHLSPMRTLIHLELSSWTQN